MNKPACPANEATRIALLRSLHILDTPPDERFDRLVRLAKRVFDVPISVVSLVDSERQWFKARVGLVATETARDHSFCGHTILGDDLFVIEDARADARFCDNPLVIGGPGIRFYAGCPITLDNDVRVGAFCIVDTKPRALNPEERGLLRDLGRIAQRELEVLQLASTDDLTGLSNRRGFEALGHHLLQVCQRASARASLLFFDLNGFKQINDGYGHGEGDLALVAFANILRSAMRGTDALARLGGDEFVALAVGTEDDTEADIIERVHRGVARYNREHPRGYELKFSVGYAPFETSQEASISRLITIADEAMYANKRAGRGARMDIEHAGRRTAFEGAH